VDDTPLQSLYCFYTCSTLIPSLSPSTLYCFHLFVYLSHLTLYINIKHKTHIQVYYRSYAPAPAAQHNEEREYTGTVRDVQLNQSMAVVLTDSKATLHPIECTYERMQVFYHLVTYCTLCCTFQLYSFSLQTTKILCRTILLFYSIFSMISTPLIPSYISFLDNIIELFSLTLFSPTLITLLLFLNHLLLLSHTLFSPPLCQLVPPHKKELEYSPHARKVRSQE
jgi:hypothetical protein